MTELPPLPDFPDPGVTASCRGPGLGFHLVSLVPALSLSWSLSVPGIIFLLWALAALALGVGVVAWAVRLVRFGLARARGEATRGSWRFLLVPVAGVLLVNVIQADLPLRARWAMSRSSFEAVVQEVLADDEDSSWFDDEKRIGSYVITAVYRQEDSVIFRERNGSGLNRAGFAYLPTGARPEVDDPHHGLTLRHLGGPWYEWVGGL